MIDLTSELKLSSNKVSASSNTKYCKWDGLIIPTIQVRAPYSIQ